MSEPSSKSAVGSIPLKKLLPETLKLGVLSILSSFSNWNCASECEYFTKTVFCEQPGGTLYKNATFFFLFFPPKYYTQWNSKCAPKITARFGDNDSYITLHSQQIRRTSDSKVDMASKAAKESTEFTDNCDAIPNTRAKCGGQTTRYSHWCPVIPFEHLLFPLLVSSVFSDSTKALNMTWLQYYNNMFITIYSISRLII